uniref:Peptidase S1 domain-containing protein n=1 Tax=Tetraodon nigroviridis TaxID=99883 RepID=H3DLM6_TETNG
MLILLLFTALSATALAVSDLRNDDTWSSIAGRIVGGVEVPYHTSWPWQVSLQYYSEGSYHHFCGGTLIRTQWVMTSAHCVYSPRSISAVLGDLRLFYNDGTEQTRHVINVYVHPEWNSESISSGNDIALLKLSSPVSITSYVKLASLPSFGEILPHNNLCYLTGYGRTSSQPEFPSILKIWLNLHFVTQDSVVFFNSSEIFSFSKHHDEKQQSTCCRLILGGLWRPS